MWQYLREKKFWELILAKLKTAITFVSGIRMTIIIYAFGVEKNSHTVATDSPKLEKSVVY